MKIIAVFQHDYEIRKILYFFPVHIFIASPNSNTVVETDLKHMQTAIIFVMRAIFMTIAAVTVAFLFSLSSLIFTLLPFIQLIRDYDEDENKTVWSRMCIYQQARHSLISGFMEPKTYIIRNIYIALC